jgi:hypothetical protein
MPGPRRRRFPRGPRRGADRQAALLRVGARLALGRIDERANHHVPGVGPQLRGHRFQRPLEEQVEQQRLDDVVGMVPERDLGRTFLAGHAVQDPAPQPRAECARRRSRPQHVVHDLANRGVLDATGPAPGAAGAGDQAVAEVLVARIDGHGHERERDGSVPAKHVEHLQQRPGVLAAAQADQDAVAVVDQAVIDNRARRLPGQPGFQRGPVGHDAVYTDEAVGGRAAPWRGACPTPRSGGVSGKMAAVVRRP